MNKYINITLENIDTEHLCCAISDKKHQEGVCSKKEWLKERLKEGHVFRKLDAQGKVFIEYAPVEKAWCSVDGENYMYIHCLWVAGSYKRKGYAKELLEYTIKDAKNKKMNGICTISSKKKKPFVSEKTFFTKNGFQVVDNNNDYELLALNFNCNQKPKFTENSKKMEIKDKCLTVYYSPQCPFTNFSIQEIKDYSEKNKLKINIIKVDSCAKAKEVPCVFNNFAIFYNGKFISNSMVNYNLIEKMLR